jgi:site-specific recombinase XerD
VRQLVDAVRAALPSLSPETRTGRLARLTHLRNIAIVEMLRATGARPGETVALCLGDLDLEKQVATAPDGRLLYFDLKSWGALMHYLLVRRDPVDLPLLQQGLPLFAQHRAGSIGRPLQPLNVRMVTQLLRDLRTSPTLTATSLRIRFGRKLLAATADERGTARLLGLKTLASVRRYLEP